MIFRPRSYAPAFRLSPRAVMREARVVGFMPSNSAAWPGPKTLPPVCLSAVAMLSRSFGGHGGHVKTIASANEIDLVRRQWIHFRLRRNALGFVVIFCLLLQDFWSQQYLKITSCHVFVWMVFKLWNTKHEIRKTCLLV